VCGKNRISYANELERQFMYNPYCSYNLYYNSTQNKRGVGILVKRALNFTVHRQIADQEENFILLDATLSGSKVTLGSIYGPNTLNQQFFDSLTRGCKDLGNDKILLAGDWNCTFSMDPVERNVDCLNMGMVPSLRHSRLLRLMCNELNITDPFRMLHPNKKDFSYIPMQITDLVLTFFLASNTLLEIDFECGIAHHLQNQNKMFDHKACTL
jgi:exonuclease III